MPKANIHPTDLTVTVAKNGHALIFQGFYHQALFISREHVPRFLEAPQQAVMLVIPPFAATALACYTAMEAHLSIKISQDLSLSDAFSLLITTARGAKIAYHSDHAACNRPRATACQGVSITITPKSVASVDQSETGPALSLIANIPNPQVPDYRGRFAVAPNVIKESLEEALNKANSVQRYAR